MTINPTDLQPGDLLLFRKSYLVGQIIGLITRSQYSHAAIYLGSGYVGEFLYCEGYNVATIEELSERGTTITVFRAKTDLIIRQFAAEKMRLLTNQPYSWSHVAKAYLYRRLPASLRPQWMNRELDRGEYHCSQSVSKAYRLAGFDLRLDKPDWATAPGDIATSERVERIGELTF